VMWVDTHTHLYSEEFKPDRAALIERAIAKGITKFYLPNIDSSSIEGMLELEAQFPLHCFALMGLHPCSVKENVNSELAVVEEWLAKRKFAAIGEIGIDLYWDKTFFEEQKLAFETQIAWALKYNYAIVIHCRQAFEEIYDILRSFSTLPKGIFHCFSGNIEQAKKIIDLGNFKLGIGGVVTFKNSGLDHVVEKIDLEHLVLETDAPYLAPVPHRGKRNEPSYILEVAKKVALLKGVSMQKLAEVTCKNAEFIYKNA
jgi:TatD DNase family protein